ncbi:hypothetical protein JW960_12025 [candidate division KSB1 bacterium]|nr:hypothetical protein [candidate division KSB1 bacterium]
MCGIFGVVCKSEQTNNLPKSLQFLARLSESRGKEAGGFMFALNNSIHVFKRPQPVTVLLKSSEYRTYYQSTIQQKILASNTPVVAIGHSRLVTNGAQTVHANNQPVATEGVVGVHNGIIVNDQKLWKQFGWQHPDNALDSEIIFRLSRYFLTKSGSLPDAIACTFQTIKGSASIAMLIDDQNYLTLATNNGSVYTCRNDAHNFLAFASERYIVDKLIEQPFLNGHSPGCIISQLVPGTACLVNLMDLTEQHFFLNDSHSLDSTRFIPTAKRTLVDVQPAQSDSARYKGITIHPNGPVPKNFITHADKVERAVNTLQRCTRCLLPSTMPFVDFDKDGVCRYCRTYQSVPVKGHAAFEALVAPYRKTRHQQDVIIGYSGGRDSSYALHYFKKVLGMQPITYTYDWGMVTDLARRNISRMCAKLGVENILISADIQRKRTFIRQNIEAWLKRPHLGMVPLFMAGDKQFFHYAKVLSKRTGIDLVFYARNVYEKTNFKTGFCGIHENQDLNKRVYELSLAGKMKLTYFYARQLLTNPAYLNSSLIDTGWSFFLSFFTKHLHRQIFQYIPWNEHEIMTTLRNEYDWETAGDTSATWRIGDGTAAFYNYIYYVVAGFTETDTFLSNLIRAGLITRAAALKRAQQENRPRFESIRWYCQIIGLDFENTLRAIQQIPIMYQMG